jgi:hypothetical protein
MDVLLVEQRAGRHQASSSTTLTRRIQETLGARNGFRVLPKRGGIVTSDQVRRLSAH